MQFYLNWTEETFLKQLLRETLRFKVKRAFINAFDLSIEYVSGAEGRRLYVSGNQRMDPEINQTDSHYAMTQAYV